MSNLEHLEQLAKAASGGAWRVASGGSDIEVAYSASGRDYSDGIAGALLDADAAYIVAVQPAHVLALIDRVRAAEAKAKAAKEYAALLSAPGTTEPKTRYERALRTARMTIGEGLTEHLSAEAQLKERENEND